MPPALETWRSAAAAVPGGGHLERGTPCQDRAAAWVSPRPALAVLDGRGSARLSHEGAEAALAALRHELACSEERLALALDEEGSDGLAAIAWQSLAQWLYAVAARTQRELATRSGEAAGEYEFTLAVAVVGARRIGWLSVGDSPLVASRSGVLFLPCGMEEVEFANQTRFVRASPGRRIGLSGGLIPTDGVELLGAMSDGAASRLLDLQGQVPAGAVRELGALLAGEEFDDPGLRDFLEDSDWDEATRDDRSLALLARSLSAPSPTTSDRISPGGENGRTHSMKSESRESVEIDAGLDAELETVDRPASHPPVPAILAGCLPWMPLVALPCLALLLWIAIAAIVVSLPQPEPPGASDREAQHDSEDGDSEEGGDEAPEEPAGTDESSSSEC